MARGQDYYTLARQYNKQLWDALNDLESLQPEWTAGDYSNELENGEGENAGLVPADINAVVNTSANAIRTFITENFHSTNLVKLL